MAALTFPYSMAATPSSMLALGTPAPEFSLPDVTTGKPLSLRDFSEKKALVVVFLCAHCPYVHHVAPELARLSQDYTDSNVGIVGITSNDVAQYPADAPEPTARFAQSSGITFPIVYDESQDVAKAYAAACTPDFYVFNADRKLVYRGQLDASRPNRGADRPGGGELNGAALRAAIEAALAGQPASEKQAASIGCSIKWKS